MSKMPPIPPENRSKKGPGEPDHGKQDPKATGRPDSRQTGQEANTRINTTHQGLTQEP